MSGPGGVALGTAEHAATVPDELIAMPAADAARLAGVSERRLRGWDELGLLTPGVTRQLSPRNTVRLYGFQELVELRMISELIGLGRPSRQIRRIVQHLRTEGHRAPLRELRFTVSGREIYFQRPDGTWAGDRRPNQLVLGPTIILPIEAYRLQVRHAAQTGRTPDEVGRTGRYRKVHGHKEVYAGTRIPVEAVIAYLRRDLPEERILAAYPDLTSEDIAAARRVAASGG